MAVEIPSLGGGGETLAAVVLGALLATVSGVVATRLEAVFERRRRERWAAMLFGQVFSALRVILEGADASRARGEPYGAITRRMLHAARREIDIYERNREALMDLTDARLRADMHGLAVRLAMPIDGILDSLIAGPRSDDAARDRAFDFILENLAAVEPLVARLGRVGGHAFEHFDSMSGPGSGTGPGP